MTETIINKIAISDIITIDLADFYPNKKNLVEIDIKKYLFMEMILKEKDFREKLKEEDFSIYKNKYICIFNSIEAIIPSWAYMLLASYLKDYTQFIYFGNKDNCAEYFFLELFNKHLLETDYNDKKVIIKGCGEIKISENAYLIASTKLLPKVKSLMFGEACSTVPIFKKKLI